MSALSDQAYFKNQFFELVLKKSLSLSFDTANCYLELMDEGDTLCMVSLLYENPKGFSEDFILEIEDLEAKGLVVDRIKGQVLIARKHDFRGMTPQIFSIRVAQFLSEAQEYQKDIDGFRQNEYAYIKRP